MLAAPLAMPVAACPALPINRRPPPVRTPPLPKALPEMACCASAYGQASSSAARRAVGKATREGFITPPETFDLDTV